MEEGEKVYTGTVRELFCNPSFMREIGALMHGGVQVSPDFTALETLKAALWQLDGMEEALHSQRSLIRAAMEKIGGAA